MCKTEFGIPTKLTFDHETPPTIISVVEPHMSHKYTTRHRIRYEQNKVLSRVCLQIHLPTLPHGWQWVSDIASRCLSSVSLHVGGNNLSGNISGEANAMLAHVHRENMVYNGNMLIIPLMLPMTRFSHHALPLLRLSSHLVDIVVKLNHLQGLCQRVSDKDVCTSDAVPQFDNVKSTLLTEVALIPNPMAKRWRTFRTSFPPYTKHNWRFRMWHVQLQWQSLQVGNLKKLSDVSLPFAYVTSGIVILCRRRTQNKCPTMPISPIKHVHLYFDDISVLSDTGQRMLSSQWLRCGVPAPKQDRSHYWYVLPFSHAMFTAKGNHALATGRVEDIKLACTVNASALKDEWEIDICAPTFNVACTTGGILGLMFMSSRK